MGAVLPLETGELGSSEHLFSSFHLLLLLCFFSIIPFLFSLLTPVPNV